MGLWLAEIMSPPAAWWCSTANWQVGVVVSPRSITWTPTDWRAATTERWNIGPETRLSRPTTTGLPEFDAAHEPNAAA
jgi:hypothetical protein